MAYSVGHAGYSSSTSPPTEKVDCTLQQPPLTACLCLCRVVLLILFIFHLQFVGLLAGIIYFQTKINQAGVTNISGAFFFFLASITFDNLGSVVFVSVFISLFVALNFQFCLASWLKRYHQIISKVLSIKKQERPVWTCVCQNRIVKHAVITLGFVTSSVSLCACTVV